ncbi:MAG TPA: hypothetical protein VN999_08325 [Thermoanaerobaculia bacterium]|nr:hypothetical protein [Thermoanaerobaculia bacterium]
MPDFLDDLDPADKILAAGVLSLGSLGLSIPGMITLGAVEEITLLTALGTLSTVVAPIALVPALLVTGLYTRTATESEARDWLKAASKVNDAVRIANRPIEWLEDKLLEYVNAPEGSSLAVELSSSREKTSRDRAIGILKTSIQEVTDNLLKPSDVEKGAPSRNDPAGTRSPSRTDGPMCTPDDPADHGGPVDDGGPVDHGEKPTHEDPVQTRA